MEALYHQVANQLKYCRLMLWWNLKAQNVNVYLFLAKETSNRSNTLEL